MKTSILALGFATVASMAAAQDKPVLTVLTYDSFTAEWGPGPAVEQAFEATCACDVQFQTAGDGAALLARLQLEGAATTADVVVGLDTNLADAARPKPALGDGTAQHGGLSDLGRQAIAEMNRIGLIIDVSHAAKSSMMQAAALSRAPPVCARRIR